MQATDPTTVLAGRYALDEPLGRSATGMVWLATDTLLRRRVTVKLVHPRLADDPAFAEALDAAVRRVAGVASPGLARLLDSGRDRGISFVVREHVDGRSLRSLLDRDGPLPHEDAVRTLVEVLRALEGAHAAGVLHLALDADDVIVSERGDVRVTDLGIGAAVAAARAPEAQTLLGPERLAPEQVDGRVVDARTDVFAAGVIAFEVLTGDLPGGRTSVRALRPEVPRGIDRAVARALDPDPERRFPDASAFERALSTAAAEGEAAEAEGRGGILSWLGLPLVVLGVAAAAVALGLWAGTIEVGGPLGIRPSRDEPAPAEVTLRAERPGSAAAIDPFGDGTELSANAPRAVDGHPTTLWRSEDYFDGELGKPGIGLVLDLGRTRHVVGLRLWTPHPGYTFQVAVGEDPDALVEDVGAAEIAAPLTRLTLDATGRYVLLWITSVVPTGDGNRAEVAEARVVVAEGADA
jgi:serine/threonine-protein kinase